MLLSTHTKKEKEKRKEKEVAHFRAFACHILLQGNVNSLESLKAL
jgi:hypothetical protein